MENEIDLEKALIWLNNLVTGFLKARLGQTDEFEPRMIDLSGDGWLAQLNADKKIILEEFALLMLALAPHISPHFFNQLIAQQLEEKVDFPEFCAVKNPHHQGISPTGETAQFLLAGQNIQKRLEIQRLLSSEHFFAQDHILWLEPVKEGEPLMSGRLMLNPEIIEQLILGGVSKPHFGLNAPAEQLETKLNWTDLTLHADTLCKVDDINHWIQYKDALQQEWGLNKKGYRALFLGHSGTGKTLTATLLGKQNGMQVYRIDLSHLRSKLISEADISRLLNKAQHETCILFFNGAEALFEKRSDHENTHHEAASFLQSIENYKGLTIIASNQNTSIDETFARHFQSIIHFPMPGAEERFRLWQNSFPSKMKIGPEIDLKQIAAHHELTGAAILNIIQYCAIRMLAAESVQLEANLLKSAIQRELTRQVQII